MSTPCVSEEKNLGSTDDPILKRLNDRLIASEKQNKRLKDLLVYNLDLIQQQNDLISRNEKLYQVLRQENETIKNKLNRRHGLNLPPPSPPPSSEMIPASEPSISMIKTEPSEILFSSFNELLMPENCSNSFLFDSDLIKSEEIERSTIDFPSANSPSVSDMKPFLAHDTKTTSIMESTKSKYSKIEYEDLKSVGEKRSLTKKEEPQFAVSTCVNSLMDQVKKDKRKNTTGTIFNYSPDSSAVTNKPSELINALQEYDYFGINRKSKALNTYSKMKTATTTCTITSTTNTSSTSKRSTFGSLSDRLQLIDTTPTGEDPYLLGEADLKQSPIPKLMLQKTNQGHLKVLDQPTRRIYDPDSSMRNTFKAQTNRLMSSSTDQKTEAETSIIQEPDLHFVQSVPNAEWQSCQLSSKMNPETGTSAVSSISKSDLSSCIQSNVASNVSINPHELQNILTTSSATNIGELTVTSTISTILKISTERSNKQATRTAGCSSSLLDSLENTTDIKLEDQPLPQTMKQSKLGRKRQRSSISKGGKGGKGSKGGKGAKTQTKRRPRRKTEVSNKKIPFPEKTTKMEYHTYVGDPDLSWYFGLDTEIKVDDIDRFAMKKSFVEVPRWREKACTSIDTSEGTENLDDKMFEKRHHKFEAEERRQLRWHMRRIREQRHLEKLKQRQLDTWSTTVTTPPVYTVWPRPQKDIQFIEITDTLPVMAFGEPIPDLPDEDFILPWVRTSEALKRSKRSKTHYKISSN